MLTCSIPMGFASPLSASALEVGYENKDFRYENPTPVQEYAIERGIYTDRFLFLMVIHTRTIVKSIQARICGMLTI